VGEYWFSVFSSSFWLVILGFTSVPPKFFLHVGFVLMFKKAPFCKIGGKGYIFFSRQMFFLPSQHVIPGGGGNSAVIPDKRCLIPWALSRGSINPAGLNSSVVLPESPQICGDSIVVSQSLCKNGHARNGTRTPCVSGSGSIHNTTRPMA